MGSFRQILYGSHLIYDMEIIISALSYHEVVVRIKLDNIWIYFKIY